MSEQKTYNDLAGRKIQRIETISDGVFSIAMTLLVLGIGVPTIAQAKTESDVMNVLAGLVPRLLTYFLSFMTLGIFWTGQSTQFSYIDKSDRNLNWITLFFLMFVSILPFTTAFLSVYIHFKIALGIYWLNLFILGVIIYVNWMYAYSHDFVSSEIHDKAFINKAVRKRIIVAQSLYAGAALLCFINIYLSIIVIICIQLNYALALFTGRKNKIKKS